MPCMCGCELHTATCRHQGAGLLALLMISGGLWELELCLPCPTAALQLCAPLPRRVPVCCNGGTLGGADVHGGQGAVQGKVMARQRPQLPALISRQPDTDQQLSCLQSQMCAELRNAVTCGVLPFCCPAVPGFLCQSVYSCKCGGGSTGCSGQPARRLHLCSAVDGDSRRHRAATDGAALACSTDCVPIRV